MSKYNICIIRPNGYIWSSIFGELSELLAYSIADLGHSVNIAENFIINDGINILIGGHLIGFDNFNQIPKNSIIFNTEQIGSGPKIWNEKILYLARKFEVWDFSRKNIQILTNYGIPSPRYFKFGYHKKLERIPKISNKDIDVLFYGSMNEKRANILRQLKQKNLNVVTLYGQFGFDRDSYISRSKIVLNMHQYNTKDFEIIRVHYLMNNGRAIVSQVDEDTHIDPEYAQGLVATNYHDLTKTCISVLANNERMDELECLSLDVIKKTNSIAIMENLISGYKI